LSAASAALAADPPDDDVYPKPAAKDNGSSGGLFQGWFQGKRHGRQKPPPKPDKDAKKEDKPVVDESANSLDKEQKAFLRRLAVCDELRKIAQATNDEALFEKADKLNERIWALYKERTAPLAGNQFESDEKVLEKHLGPGTASRSLTPDTAASQPLPDHSSRALAQEERP